MTPPPRNALARNHASLDAPSPAHPASPVPDAGSPALFALPDVADPHAEGFAAPVADADAAADADAESEAAIAHACGLVPPLWTLRNFVAVNPYLGLLDRTFVEAAGEAGRLFGAAGFAPDGYFHEQYASGRIRDEDLEAGIARARRELGDGWPKGLDREALRGLVRQHHPARRPLPCLAEQIDQRDGTALARVAEEEIAGFCAARFDAGVSSWKPPTDDPSLYGAWRAAAGLDRAPALRGYRGFRATVRALPSDPAETIAHVLRALDLPAEAARGYLARLLATIAGWAGHLRYRAWPSAPGDDLRELLAIRIAFEAALLDRIDPAVARAAILAHTPDPAPRPLPDFDPDAAPDDATLHAARYAWQLALEIGWRRTLIGRLAHGPSAPAAPARPELDAVFCIDVRSEVIRRRLEGVSDTVRTRGFAGFFGLPIEWVLPGDEAGSACCPVLLEPPHRVHACGPDGEGDDAGLGVEHARHAWFLDLRKQSVGSFPLVETAGWFFGLRLVTDSLGWTGPQPGGALFEGRARRRLAPPAADAATDDTVAGIALEDAITLAENALRGMAMTSDFARVVLLCGHGSHSTNNPYASSLDCGACGGHAGAVNARVACAILSDPRVRRGLAERGLPIPDDTRFVAGLHDTTTDAIGLLDPAAAADATLDRLRAWLDEAGEATRRERAPGLGESPGARLLRRLRRRARDWSEVRPEWGLAGNAAFVAGRRAHTRGLDLGGRVFLHEYDPGADADGAGLEAILNAPLVVASWINLQYYGSTVDNARFGSGDKTIHNVVGRLGVIEGQRGDLRSGLPWQSVHDGRRFVHEPLRLHAVVEAPRERIDAVIDRSPEVARLVDHGWIQLIAWEPDTGRFHHRHPGGWTALRDGA